MKKIFLSLAILATTMTAFAANDNQSKSSDAQCTVNKECCSQNGECPDGKKLKGNKGGDNSLFKGITLTDDQKSKLKALREKNKACNDKAKGECKAKGDSVREKLTPEQKQQKKAEREAKKAEARKSYLNGVKEILTADQYVVFLENNFLYGSKDKKNGMKDGRAGGPGAKMAKGGRQMKDGKFQKRVSREVMKENRAAQSATLKTE